MSNGGSSLSAVSKEIFFDNSPNACVLFSEKMRVIDCNSAAVEFFEFPSKDECLTGLVRRILDGIPATQPSGRASIPLEQRLKTTLEEGDHAFSTELCIKGQSKYIHVRFKRVDLVGDRAIACFVVERHEPEERTQLMLDSTPLACIVLDMNRGIIDCNLAAALLFGHSSKEEYLERYSENVPEMQPSGIKSQEYISSRVHEAMRKGDAFFTFNFQLANGDPIPTEIILRRLEWRGGYVVAGYARDIRIHEETKQQLARHSSLLRTVNTVAISLIESDPFTFGEVVIDALKTMGQAVGVDRAHIWKNYEDDGKLLCRQLYEWSGDEKYQRGVDFAAVMDYADIPSWKAMAFSNRCLHGPVRLMPAEERDILEEQNTKSVILIPIYYGNRFWGFIGFDDCHSERVFTKAEERVLQSCGILITSAILRNEMMTRLLDARSSVMEQDKLLRAVNKVARLLLETDHSDFNGTAAQALETLGRSISAHHTTIWRNFTDERGRACGTLLASWFLGGSGHAPAGLTIDYESYLPEWKDSRCDINKDVRELSGPVQAHSLTAGAESLLLLRISIQGEFWGFIGFAHKRRSHSFGETELSILRSGGMLLASAIMRNEITEKLVEARESALASAYAKSTFLSRMSHEMRTPMNAIIGMTTLSKKSDDLTKIKQYLEKVDASSWQLLGIINDVLDMSKIEANKLEIVNREFDFDKILRHVFNVVQLKLEEKKQVFRFDYPHVFKRNIICDEMRLSQVLINLLSNAIKFTPAYGTITLKVRETPKDGNKSLLRLEVIDNGIGIAEKNLKSIFQLFEQADGGITRHYGGTGLGLAICRQLVELMGGSIWAESEQGNGSSFIIEMDVEWGGSREYGAGAPALKPNLKTLVVDDDPCVLEYFKEVMRNFAVDCDVASNGANAVEMARVKDAAGEPYDVVFVDWFMPGMNGSKTAREIKRVTGGNAIVVMISSADWSDIEKETAKYGISHFMPKPVLSSDIYNLLIQLTSAQTRGEGGLNDNDGYDWGGRRLLLAEDIAINREIVTEIMRPTGVEIECAENGMEALEMFTAHPDRYDLILMDVQMPVLDGLSAARRIRESGAPGAGDIPIIAMTANAFKEDEQASRDAGMNGHISKPIDVDSVFKTLNKYLR